MSGRAAPSGPPARLLLADSDPALRRVLYLALEAHGYQVAFADTAAAALELAGHQQPDLIVLLNTVAQAVANGDNADLIAAERIRQLLDARPSRSSEPVTPACSPSPTSVTATCHSTPATCCTSTSRAASSRGST